MFCHLKNAHRTSHKRYFLRTVEIKDYNVIIDGENVFDHPVKNDKLTYENIRKNASSLGDDYTTVCLLDYPYLKEHYKLIAVELSKQQALDADPRAIHQTDFTGNLNCARNMTMFFILSFCTSYKEL